MADSIAFCPSEVVYGCFQRRFRFFWYSLVTFKRLVILSSDFWEASGTFKRHLAFLTGFYHFQVIFHWQFSVTFWFCRYFRVTFTFFKGVLELLSAFWHSQAESDVFKWFLAATSLNWRFRNFFHFKVAPRCSDFWHFSFQNLLYVRSTFKLLFRGLLYSQATFDTLWRFVPCVIQHNFFSK